MSQALKGIVLVILGLFLYSRISDGTLLFYINQSFVWLTLLAAIGLILIGASYGQRRATGHQHDSDHHGHSHEKPPVAWAGLLLLALPVILGLLVPPKPLGASVISNREVNVGTLSSVVQPGKKTTVENVGEKNILDWLVAFQRKPDPSVFSQQGARVVGFVYRDSEFGDDTFMVSRFVISCCVADATVAGLVVRWPQAKKLANDQWVEVAGQFEPGQFGNKSIPFLVAAQVTPVQQPNQPYLYP
ncbi:MAG: TIGR03943 family protein [Chloroflexi bacterium]|nr:TIGR03943 family protein [Chloroflexota bacterium]